MIIETLIIIGFQMAVRIVHWTVCAYNLGTTRASGRIFNCSTAKVQKGDDCLCNPTVTRVSSHIHMTNI